MRSDTKEEHVTQLSNWEKTSNSWNAEFFSIEKGYGLICGRNPTAFEVNRILLCRIFAERAGKPGKRLPGAVMQSPPLAAFKIQLDKALASLIWCGNFQQETWLGDHQRSLPI